MRITGRQLAEAIAEHLSDIAECRVHSFGPDTFLPPGIIVSPPSMSWSEDRTFGLISWGFELQVIVARPNDKTPHDELDRLMVAIEARLGDDPTIGEVASYSQLVNAEPATVSVNGTDYPAYIVNLTVLA